MPNPKRKHTRSRRDSRRSQNWKLAKLSLSLCTNKACGRLRPPHVICPYCGFYKGKLLLAPKQKKSQSGEGEQGQSKE